MCFVIGAAFLGKVRMRVKEAFHSLTPLHAFRTRHGTRQIEDGAHKLLRAAATCACLELACTQTALEAGPPSTVPIAWACGLLNARLATQLDRGAARAVLPPYAGLAATVEALQAMSKAMYTAVRVRSAVFAT